MTAGFRYEPSTLGADVLHRPRLVGMLSKRFEHRVTLVTAAAGFGKSTALALAVDNNRLDPQGVDIWFGAVDADTDPEHLLAGLAQAVGVEPAGTTEHVRQRISDALWSQAPDEVCIFIDDTHKLRSQGARDELRHLIDALPVNGHMLLAGRPTERLALARLRAADEVLELTEADIALDDGEVSALAVRHDASDAAADLPRHAATARLALLVGEEAGAEFLWEEVLSTIHPDRLADLARVSVLEEFDDEMVTAITDGRFTAPGLIKGVPLVDAQADGRWRLHALLRRALIDRLEEGAERKTLSLAADIERQRGRYANAITLHERARDPISVLDTARELALEPILRHSIEELLVARRAVETLDHDGPIRAAIGALHLWVAAAGQSSGISNDVLPAAAAAIARAREAGDIQVESSQLFLTIQLQLSEHLGADPACIERLGELAPLHPAAATLHLVAEASVHRRDGDVAGALARLDQVRLEGSADGQHLLSGEYTDLGRPEMVGVGLTADDVDHEESNAELMTAYGMWLRGEAPPELAEAVVAEQIPHVMRRGFDVASLSILGVGAVIATMAGEWDIARRRIDQAQPIAAAGITRAVELWPAVAEAALAVENDSERAAAKLLDPKRTGVGFEHFPERPHLMILSLIYVVRPDARAMLDRTEFGSSLTTAVDAGRAVLKERKGDLAPAAALPWESSPWLLRAAVMPRHLIELACAAMLGSTGARRAAAERVMREVPHLHEHLLRVAEHPHRPIAQLAKQLSGGVARRAPFALHTDLLGRITLVRNGVPVTDTDFDRRAKVRELWAYLVEHHECSRTDVVEALWPGHEDETKALGNLRSALATLQRVLEPDRESSAPPFFLRADNDRLTLHPSVTTDVAEFERLVADARDADASGVPARSRALHQRAAELYRGDYLTFLDTGWATLTRVRLQALAVSAMCRVAELTAAQGEPEQALYWTQRALAIDPLAERAIVTMLASMQASGAITPARAAAQTAVDQLTEAGLTPGPSLRRTIARIG